MPETSPLIVTCSCHTDLGKLRIGLTKSFDASWTSSVLLWFVETFYVRSVEAVTAFFDTVFLFFCLFLIGVTELSPLTVIKPFLDVIRHNHTSSAVTSASLQALMSFVQLWPWVDVQDENVAADTVSDIVDVVSHCRFQAESIEGDQNALVLVAHVLHAVMRSPYGARLSDHSMWQLVQSLYALNRGSQYDVRFATLLTCGFCILVGRLGKGVY